MSCSYQRLLSIAAVLCLIVIAVLAPSCTKDVEEADKFPRSDEEPALEPGELVTFRLANGIIVYMREERTRPEIAVEVLYRAGVLHEGAGRAQVSCLLPHMLIFGASAGYEAGGAVSEIQKDGRVNGEIAGLFTNFDYIVPAGKLDLALGVESERLTSAVFTDDLLDTYMKKCAADLKRVLDEKQLSLTKYGLMAFNQVYNYGVTSIPIDKGITNHTLADVERFRQARYRLDNMIISIVGDFDAVEATALVKQRFESITQEPAPASRPASPAQNDIAATWDIPAKVLFLVFPGPYENLEHRLVMTMFGSFLARELSNNQPLYTSVNSTYCSNQVYPVTDDVPFFVFLDIKDRHNIDDVRAAAALALSDAMGKLNESIFNLLKTNIVSFLESSLLEASFNVDAVPHFQLIAQEALNVGIKHYFREGHSTEEFVALVRSITYEDAKAYAQTVLTTENMKTVTISGE